MQEGNLVVLPRKRTSQIAIGRVTGPYRYAEVHTALRHTRSVEWVRPDIPRATFEQDLLYSFGAFMTVCNISRNDAGWRVAAVLAGQPDPGPSVLWLDAPRLCVQIKSQNSPADVTVYRTLLGAMQTFKAEQGLLVCWGGVNKVVLAEAKQGHFMVRLWDSR